VTPESTGEPPGADAAAAEPETPGRDEEGRASAAESTGAPGPPGEGTGSPRSREAGPRRRARAGTRRKTSISMPSVSVPPIGEISSSATRIIQQAADILEEEVAAGIQAARGMESRFIDIEETRAHDPTEVISRIRKDAHELIDILVDLVDVAGSRAGDMVGMVTSMAGKEEQGDTRLSAPAGTSRRTWPRSAGRGPSVSVLAVPTPIAPGSSAEVIMTVDNDGLSPTGPFGFVCSDLVDAGGHRIPPDAVQFNPATLSLGPESRTRMTVTVTPPVGTPPGSYSGMMQATVLEQLKAILSFDVG